MTRFPHFAHLKLSDLSEPSAVVDRAQFDERTSQHAKGPGWRAIGLAGGEDGEEIGYVPKRDDDATCVRFDRKLAATTEGSPTVGGGILGQTVLQGLAVVQGLESILGQTVLQGLESVQRHVGTCVVVAVKAEFCVECVGAL